MAVPSNQFRTFDAVGNREHLEDFIDILDTSATPFLSTIGTKTTDAVYHEWQTDSLDESAPVFRLQGDDPDNVAITPTTRLGNYCAILRETFNISGTQEAVNSAGRASEMDYQTIKHVKALRKKIERVCLARNEKVAPSGGTPGEAAGYFAWATVTSNGTSGTAPTGDGTDTGTTGSARVLSVSMMKDVLGELNDNGAEPSLALAGSFNKRQISENFSGIATRYREVGSSDQAQIIDGADLYVSDWGTISIKYCRHVDPSAVYVFNPADLALVNLKSRAMVKETLAKNGDSSRVMILSEFTLEAKQPKALGLIRDLTTA